MCGEQIVRSEQITKSLHLQISIVNSTCDRCTSFVEKMDRFFIHPGVGNNFLQPHIASQESYSTKIVRRIDPIAFFIDFLEYNRGFESRSL